MASFNDEDCISDSAYESDEDIVIKYDYDALCSIFRLDNISMLKDALRHMTPKEIYKMMKQECFTHVTDEGDYEPYKTIRCFKYLIKRGLDINEKDDDENTPLHYTCMYNQRAICYLLKNGANPNIYNDEGVDSVYCYLDYYKGSGLLSFLKESIKYGYQFDDNEKRKVLITNMRSILIFDEDTDEFEEVLDFFIEKGFNINYQDDGGNTFMHGSLITNKIVEKMIEILFNRGFNFKLENNKGITVVNSLYIDKYRATEEDKQIMKDKIVNKLRDLEYPDVKDALE